MTLPLRGWDRPSHLKSTGREAIEGWTQEHIMVNVRIVSGDVECQLRSSLTNGIPLISAIVLRRSAMVPNHVVFTERAQSELCQAEVERSGKKKTGLTKKRLHTERWMNKIRRHLAILTLCEA